MLRRTDPSAFAACSAKDPLRDAVGIAILASASMNTMKLSRQIAHDIIRRPERRWQKTGAKGGSGYGLPLMVLIPGWGPGIDSSVPFLATGCQGIEGGIHAFLDCSGMQPAPRRTVRRVPRHR